MFAVYWRAEHTSILDILSFSHVFHCSGQGLLDPLGVSSSGPALGMLLWPHAFLRGSGHITCTDNNVEVLPMFSPAKLHDRWSLHPCFGLGAQSPDPMSLNLNLCVRPFAVTLRRLRAGPPFPLWPLWHAVFLLRCSRAPIY